MTLLTAWLGFPLVLALLCAGNALLLERVSGFNLPGPLLLPVGFVLVSLEGQFSILSAATADLAAPLAVACAVAGLGLSLQRRPIRFDCWPIGAALIVFGAFAAPVVLSGRATFAGYIKLDDTATYLAMLDQAMHHGYSVTGLPPSTYEATLKTSLSLGYPLGSLLPLGIGRALIGGDLAWVWQPYLSFLASIVGLALYQLVSGFVASRGLRLVVACFGAQAALLYGYALWGGVKELATAGLVALLACLVPVTLARLGKLRGVLPLGAACAGLLGTLSVGGAVWLAPLLLGVWALASRSAGMGRALLTSAGFIVATGVFSIPALVEAFTWLSHAGAFTGGTELGNLIRKLDWLQVFGIWPNGDFRTPPGDLGVTYVLVSVVGVAAAFAGAWAWRAKAWELPLALSTVAVACGVYVRFGSPWIGGKSLASASPIVVAAALASAAVLFERGRRVEGAVAAGVMVAGLLWSNSLQYREAYLAPNVRLTELATVGIRFAGQTPTLLTEFEPYGARHFLRNMQAEGASELRRSAVSLRSGGVADTGVTPDLDEIQLTSVLFYKTLVLRRSGTESRPPSIYAPVWTGRYYEVWQRPDRSSAIIEHLSLGSRLQPSAVPACAQVLRLGRIAAAVHGVLATVERPRAIVIEADGTVHTPTIFGAYGEDPATLYLTSPYTLRARLFALKDGAYGVWVGGSFRALVTVTIDGKVIGAARDELNWPSTFVSLGSAHLRRGGHLLQLRYSGPDLHPGSAGVPPFGIGPIVVAQGTAERVVRYIQPEDARTLCGKNLDWIEALRG